MPADVVPFRSGAGGSVPFWRPRYLNALAMAASRGVAVLLQLLVQVVVGWLSGPAGLGVLQLFTSWTCIGGEVLARGMPARAMRVSAVAWERGQNNVCRDQLADSARAILRLSWLVAPVALLALLAGGSSAGPGGSQSLGLLFLAVCLAAPIFALTRLGSEVLKATDAPLQAITLENLVLPGFILLAGFACWLFWGEMPVSALLAAGICGLVLAALSLVGALRQRIPVRARATSDVGPIEVPATELRALWANSVLSIVFMHLPFLLLPWFASVEAVGVFAVAHKLVNVITTLLILLASVFGPVFARLAAAGDVCALGGALRRTQWISLLIFLPLVSLLLLAGGALAGLFNLPAGSLSPYIVALAAGQLINAATGLPGVMLNMVGEARQELIILLSSLLLALAAAPLVGYFYGAIGIAWMFSAVLGCKNLASLALAWRYLANRRNHSETP